MLRRRAGKRVPPHLVKMRAADTLSVVFPQAQSRARENIVGPREVPDHPLVFETIRDCLVEAMDVEGLRELLEQLERGEIQVIARDTVEPSPLSHELINANPYAFLDDAPLEERRTRAVQLRRGLPARDRSRRRRRSSTTPRSRLPPRRSRRPSAMPTSCTTRCSRCGSCPSALGESLAPGSRDWFDALAAMRAARRGCAGTLRASVHAAWVATERLGAARAVLGELVEATPMIATPAWADRPEREASDRQDRRRAPRSSRPGVDARARRRARPARCRTCSARCSRSRATARSCAARSPRVLRSRRRTVKEALAAADDSALLADTEWCNRRVLARIHRLTLARLRREIEPVSAAALMRFLLRWQRVAQAQPG